MINIYLGPIIKKAIDFLTWGIKLKPVVPSAPSTVSFTSVVSWFHRRKLIGRDSFMPELVSVSPGRGGRILDLALSSFLVLSLLGTIAIFSFVISRPANVEKFSEFYILGENGKATDYPEEVAIGNTARVIVGIINHEQKTESYRVEIRINDLKNNEKGMIELGNEEKYEESLVFTPNAVGDRQRVEFLLFHDNSTEPIMKPLYLWINVKG